MEKIIYQHEPTDLQCGQAALGMICNIPAETVAKMLNNQRETTFKQMQTFLAAHGFALSKQKRPCNAFSALPRLCLLSLQTPKCWHWSVAFMGKCYDPEYGVLDDFPPSSRRYYWEISEIN